MYDFSIFTYCLLDFSQFFNLLPINLAHPALADFICKISKSPPSTSFFQIQKLFVAVETMVKV